MSCNKSSYINITSTSETCSGQCKLLYNYEIGNVSIIKNNDHVLIKPYNLGDKPINFSATGTDSAQIGGDFAIEDIRLYKPSLHKYDGIRADAELIIHHKHLTGGQDLLICIPITSSTLYAGNQSKATSQLSEIIDHYSQLGGFFQGFKFDLNKFIPYHPYYINYAPPINKSNNNTNSTNIVFDKNFAIYLPEEKLNLLPNYSLGNIDQLESCDNTNTNVGSYMFSNQRPSLGTTALDDNIYIDCQPVGSTGELLVEEDVQTIADYNIGSYITDPNKETIMNVILSILILFFGYKLIKIILNNIKSTTSTNSSATYSGGRVGISKK